MGSESPLKGDVGEYVALDLLRRSFKDLAKGVSGAPCDWTCSELRATPESPILHRNPTLRFHFQVKTTDTAKRFDVCRKTFEHWLDRCEYEPVTLLLIRPIEVGSQAYWYLPLHEWLLGPCGQAALVHKGQKVVFKIEDGFVRSDSKGVNFHEKIVEEADRATATLSSPWSTLRDYGLYPFDETTFLQYIELAPFAEEPLDISQELMRQGTSARHVVRELVRSRAGHSRLARWFDELRRLAPEPNLTSFQRRQFKRFVSTSRGYQRGVRLPPFRIAQVSCWRSFVAMYPHSLSMLDHVVQYSKRENDLMFASALLPMLALSNNRDVSGHAWDVIRKLEPRRHGFESYAFQREMYRGPAEAGDSDKLSAGVDFITRRSSIAFERHFLDDYGWHEDVLSANLDRKLNHPKLRDQNLKRWYEAMADKLLI